MMKNATPPTRNANFYDEAWASWGLLGASWEPLGGSSWGQDGAKLGQVGPKMGQVGTKLGLSWHLEPSWGQLGGDLQDKLT